MPTYELRCDACGKRFERFLARLLREEDKVCPACGSAQVRQGPGGGYLQTGKSSAGACLSRNGFT